MADDEQPDNVLPFSRVAKDAAGGEPRPVRDLEADLIVLALITRLYNEGWDDNGLMAVETVRDWQRDYAVAGGAERAMFDLFVSGLSVAKMLVTQLAKQTSPDTVTATLAVARTVLKVELARARSEHDSSE
jgi:hypothetical protein